MDLDGLPASKYANGRRARTMRGVTIQQFSSRRHNNQHLLPSSLRPAFNIRTGTILDSGTTYTYIPNGVLRTFMEAFDQVRQRTRCFPTRVLQCRPFKTPAFVQACAARKCPMWSRNSNNYNEALEHRCYSLSREQADRIDAIFPTLTVTFGIHAHTFSQTLAVSCLSAVATSMRLLIHNHRSAH